MADQIQHRLHTEGPQEQPGLEAAQSRYSTAPIPYDPSEFQTPLEKSTWTTMTQAYHPAYAHAGGTPPPPPQPETLQRRRVLGLTVPIFWGLVIALVVILAGGIAGGVAGGLAAQKADSLAVSDNDSSSTASATAGSQSASTITGAQSSALTATSSSSTSRSIPTGIRAAPTDGGCPYINTTTYTPTDGSGNAMKVSSGSGSGSAQLFRQLCEVNYPSGAAYGNPALYDIMKVYVSTFEECMALCAAYNQAYGSNLANGDVKSGGYCRSVAMIKLPGEYCYLKNGTGKMDTQGHPKDFVSAVVISGLPDA
ncbi:hypothetical protein CORC01_03463 [Colletotrichum orchidophilum]|uniref:WSC domain-containing protein n=1 Tax=Colletotrichum orchidophilum TaxID=1209926 RepID=A0A1G4BI88_9PEZI|nr:uncharacterized protein CORC01_03463 [Colletotrichum orchidophilum]OHF01149.1 hypothetical protein CORC01_03463 [Colletotrichum orchidophilum]